MAVRFFRHIRFCKVLFFIFMLRVIVAVYACGCDLSGIISLFRRNGKLFVFRSFYGRLYCNKTTPPNRSQHLGISVIPDDMPDRAVRKAT